jgi:hypothetical protein
MANNPLPYDTPTETAVNAFTALLNTGFLVIYTGSQPALNGSLTGTLLATLDLSATAFASSTASSGTVTATANSITSATAAATGTAGYFALLESNGTTIVATGTVGTSGCDLNLNSTSISSGANVSVTSFTVTMAES